MHGYDIQSFAAQLGGEQPVDDDIVGRVKGDYRRTLAKLHLDYVNAWVNWAHEEGFKARNQAHGAPGNLLDLYGVADIPETESFGLTALPIVGLRSDAGRCERRPGSAVGHDRPLRFLGGARDGPAAGLERDADLAAREFPRVARRGEAADRPAVRGRHQSHFLSRHRLFAGRRGMAGLVFLRRDAARNYQSACGKTSARCTRYVARVQSVLQAGAPDNDVLLYWPFDDVVERSDGLMQQYGVHENKWLTNRQPAASPRKLLESGYSLRLRFRCAAQSGARERRGPVAPGARYRAIVVPATRRMPVETLARLADLREAGREGHLRIAAAGRPGLRPPRGAPRRARVRLLSSPELAAAVAGDDLQAALEKHNVPREQASQSGLAHIRRARNDGHDYFFANLGGRAFDGWLQLARPRTDPPCCSIR